jgi:hypothetical protein
MKKFEVENGGFVYMPKSYNNEDTKYIMLQFVDQSWWRGAALRALFHSGH